MSAHPGVSGTQHGSDRAVHSTFVPGITPWEEKACVSEPSEPWGRIVSHCLQGNLAFGLERQERGHCRGVTPAVVLPAVMGPAPAPAQPLLPEQPFGGGWGLWSLLGWVLFRGISGYVAMGF